MRSRKYPTKEEAYAYLNAVGKLEFFGRVGLNYEACLYKIHLFDGRVYSIQVYDDGTVELVR